MLTIERKAPGLRDGVTWRSSWRRDGEGGYTLAAKLLLSNRVDPGELFNLAISDKRLYCHARTWRSFTTTAWLAEDGGRLEWFRTMLKEAALERYVGPAVVRLCGAERLRYCPECFAAGYQSALCQLEALKRCPVHACELLDRCGRCGERTPTYALTTGFRHPFTCAFCGLCFGGPNADRLSSWNASIDTRPYVSLLTKLRPLASLQVCGSELDAWQPGVPEDGAGRRAAGFLLLAHAAGIKLDSALFSDATLRVQMLSEPGAIGALDLQRLQQRIAIYKSIRRYLRKRLGITDNPALRGRLGLVIDYRTQSIRSVERTSADVLGYFIWRNRFERDLLLNCSSLREQLRLRDSAIAWPVRAAVTNRAWGHFVWHSFAADHRVATRWTAADARLQTCEDAAWAQRRELYRTMVPHLSPVLSVSPPSLFIAKCRRDPSAEAFYVFGGTE